jgi:hypothetical protein
MNPITGAAWLVLAVLSFALGGCAAKDSAALEAAFAREESKFVRVEIEPDEESCRGTSATAFLRGREVVRIEHVIGTSWRWYVRDYYYDGGRLGLAVQRTWWLLDNEAYELPTPRAESTTRFIFEPRRPPRRTGDDPPDETTAADLADDSARLFELARRK